MIPKTGDFARKPSAGGDGQLEPLAAASNFLSIGVAIVDASGEAIDMNRAAKRYFDDAALYFPTAHELRRRLGNPMPFRKLLPMLAENIRGSNGTLTVESTETHRRIHLFSAPVRNDGSVLNVVFICDPGRQLAVSDAALRELYDFTTAEARLAGELMNGCTVDEAAEKLRIKPNTARSHLKRIFVKTDTKRQGELVRLLTMTFSSLALGD